jgi:hypothetical protein
MNKKDAFDLLPIFGRRLEFKKNETKQKKERLIHVVKIHSFIFCYNNK